MADHCGPALESRAACALALVGCVAARGPRSLTRPLASHRPLRPSSAPGAHARRPTAATVTQTTRSEARQGSARQVAFGRRHWRTQINRRGQPATDTTRHVYESGVGGRVRSACGHAHNTLEAQEAGADVVHSDGVTRAGKALGAMMGIEATQASAGWRRRRTVGGGSNVDTRRLGSAW